MLDKYFTPEEIDKLVELGPENVERVFNKKGGCRCKDCEDLRNNVAKHLEHDFYKNANDYREHERIGQIVKGAEKYPEPFNPASWTAKELLQHAMQENIDQGHYIYGLFEKIEALEQELEKAKAAIVENCDLRRELARAENTAGEYQAAYKNVCKEVEQWKGWHQSEVNAHKETVLKLSEIYKDRDDFTKEVNKEIEALKREAEYWRLRAVALRNELDAEKGIERQGESVNE